MTLKDYIKSGSTSKKDWSTARRYSRDFIPIDRQKLGAELSIMREQPKEDTSTQWPISDIYMKKALKFKRVATILYNPTLNMR